MIACGGRLFAWQWRLCVWVILVVLLPPLPETGPSAAFGQAANNAGKKKAEAPMPLAFGGILSQFDDAPDPNNEYTVAAVMSAIRHLVDRGATTAVPGTPWFARLPQCARTTTAAGGVVPLPRIRFYSRHYLRFTRDGKEPWLYRYRDGWGRVYARPVILGINHAFDLEWDEHAPVAWDPFSTFAAKRRVHVHRFLVTQDRTGAFSVLRYTSFKRILALRRPRFAHARLVDGAWVAVEPAAAGRRRSLLPGALAAEFGLPLGGVPNGTVVRMIAHSYASGALKETPPSYATHVQVRPDVLPLAAACMRRRGVFAPLADTIARRAPGPVRFMSYNIWNINRYDQGGYFSRLAKLVSQIRAADPDVVTLQEVRHDAKRDSQPQSISSYLPEYSFVYQPAMSYPEEVFTRVEEGTAILSRWPILSHDYVLLPRDLSNTDDVHQRALLRVTVATPQGAVIHTLTTHLALSEVARDASVVRMWHYMSALAPGPLVLTGDLNAEPQERAMRFLRGNATIDGVHVDGMYDAWLAQHTEPRPAKEYKNENVTRDEGLTFSTLNPQLGKRIDYALLSEDSDGWPRLCDIKTYPDHQKEAPASDHIGLVWRMALKGLTCD